MVQIIGNSMTVVGQQSVFTRNVCAVEPWLLGSNRAMRQLRRILACAALIIVAQIRACGRPACDGSPVGRADSGRLAAGRTRARQPADATSAACQCNDQQAAVCRTAAPAQFSGEASCRAAAGGTAAEENRGARRISDRFANRGAGLADAGNLQVAFARSRSIWHFHKSTRQSHCGCRLYNPAAATIAMTERFSKSTGTKSSRLAQGFDAGLGTGVYGTTTPAVPGLYANFELADALFQPLAARRFAGARDRAAAAVTNDTLLQVTLGYFELLRAAKIWEFLKRLARTSNIWPTSRRPTRRPAKACRRTQTAPGPNYR